MPKAMEDDSTTADDMPSATPADTASTSSSSSTTTTITDNVRSVRNAPVLEEHWFRSAWRPAMGWLYMAICGFDFIIAPVASMIMPFLPWAHLAYTAWMPITLQSGGLIHLAFGSVLGITAWGRSKEKVAGC
jgi:hypothetical protein